MNLLFTWFKDPPFLEFDKEVKAALLARLERRRNSSILFLYFIEVLKNKMVQLVGEKKE